MSKLFDSEFEVPTTDPQEAKGEPGTCPECGEKLDYGSFELADGSQGFYEVHCPNNDCEWSGNEWYTLTYAETTGGME